MFARWQHQDGFHGLSRSQIELRQKRAAAAYGTQLAGSGHRPGGFGQTQLEPKQGKGQKGSVTQTYPSQLSLQCLTPDRGSSQCLYIHILIYCTVIFPSRKPWCHFISVLEHPDRNLTCSMYFSQLSFISHRRAMSSWVVFLKQLKPLGQGLFTGFKRCC